MDCKWQELMNDLLYSIESNTTQVLRRINDDMNHSKLVFDEKIRSHFLPIVNNRIKDIYDRFELESSVDEFIGDNVQSPSQTNTIEQKHKISGFVIDEEETPFRKRKSNIEPKIKHHTPKKQCHKSDDASKPSYLEGITYSCVHCDGIQFNTISDLHDHWFKTHNCLLNTKPFQFYMNHEVACYYCNEIGLYRDIVKHIQCNHPNNDMIMVYPGILNKCAICHYTGDDLVHHFETMHSIILQTNVFNAICLPDELIAELLAIDIHRKLECGHCDQIFETIAQLDHHHADQHKDLKMDFHEFFDDRSAYLICGFCSSHLRRSRYIKHVENHIHAYKCTRCDFKSNDLIEMVTHDRDEHQLNSFSQYSFQFAQFLKRNYFETRVVFGNGLVVNKHNLLGTKYDDSVHFVEFIESLRAKLKQRYEIGSDFSECDTQLRSHDDLYAELEKQKKLMKNVSINGIVERHDENLLSIFMEIYEKFGIPVAISDIETIYRCRKNRESVIVQFKHYKTKSIFMERVTRIFLWTSDIGQLRNLSRLKRIYINDEMTDFYKSMVQICRQIRKQGKIYTFQITEHGIEVKRTEKSKAKIILSENELYDLIDDSKRLDKRRKRCTSRDTLAEKYLRIGHKRRVGRIQKRR